MLGRRIPVDNIPFFWTRFFNNSVQYTGYTDSFDKVHVKGSLPDQKFVAYYIKGNKVVAAATMNQLNSIMIIN